MLNYLLRCSFFFKYCELLVTVSFNPVQEELAGAKSEIHKWHSAFDNSAATPSGATPGLHLNLKIVSQIRRRLDYQ